MHDAHTLRFWRALLILPIVLSLLVLAGPAFYVTLAAPADPAIPVAAYDWLQFDGDPQHSGNNSRETAIATSNIASLRRLFRIPLPGIVDSAPVLLSAVRTSSGVRDLLFATTRQGQLLAIDAKNGDVIWSQQHDAGTCRINTSSTPCYTTAGPAIDPGRQYIYTYGLDGFVHKHRVSDGTEVIGGGWPELATLKPRDEKGSANLAIATAPNGTDTYLYVTNSGYPGDAGDYQGHVTAINLNDGTQHVFNANCSTQAVHLGPGTCPARSAIWARPGVIYAPANGHIYAATGNGPFSPAEHNWGDSVLSLKVDGAGVAGDPLQTYTPSTYAQLEQADADLGSTAPAILPLPPGSSSVVQHLAVQGGKLEYPPASPDRALLRLLNLDNLSGEGGTGNTGGEVGQPLPLPQGGDILTQPAVWVDPQDSSTWVFIANANGISGLQLQIGANGVPALVSRWTKSGEGTSPIVANGVLFYAGGGRMRALNPLDGTQLWSDSGLGNIHWESPIVANGVVYITDDASQLTAYIPSDILRWRLYMPLILH